MTPLARKSRRERDTNYKPRFDPLKYNPADAKTEKELASMIRAEGEMRVQDLSFLHRVWSYCRAFTFMKQWQSWDPETGRFWDLQELTNSWGYVCPDAWEKARYVVSRLMSSLPKIGCLPQRQTDGGERSAKSCEAVLQYMDLANETTRQELLHSFNIAVYGTTVAEIFLDKGAKTLKVGGKDKKLDLASHRIVDPYRFLPSPGATSLSKCRDVIVHSVMHVDDVYEQYGVGLEPETINLDRRPSPFRLFGGAESAFRVLEGHVNVYAYHARGCDQAKNGRVIVVARDRVLSHGDEILEHGRLPFVMWRYMGLPETLWGAPYILFQIPAIKAQNILYTSQLRSALRITSELWCFPPGVVPDEDFYNRLRPKGFNLISGDQPPQNLANQIKFIGNELAGLMEVLRQHSDDAAAFHDVSRAMHVKGADTLGQTEIAEEKDVVSLEATVRDRQAAYRESAIMRLQVQKKHGSDEIPFALIGKHKPYDYRQWKKTDYTDEIECFVAPDSGVPQTAAARIRRIEQAGKSGFLPPEAMTEPESRIALSTIYGGEDTTDKLFMSFRNQQNWARSENMKLEDGNPVSVSARDLDDAHIPIHSRQFYDSEWRLKAQPRATYLLFDHMVMHEVRKEEKEYYANIAQLDPMAQVQMREQPFEPIRSKPLIEELKKYRNAYMRTVLDSAGAEPGEIEEYLASLAAMENEAAIEEPGPPMGEQPMQELGPVEPLPEVPPAPQGATV